MFSIRIQDDANSHQLLQCFRYRAHREKDAVRLMLDTTGDYKNVTQVVIKKGGIAYVMNERGITVDVIKSDNSNGSHRDPRRS